LPVKKRSKDPAARIQKAYADLRQAHEEIKEAHMAIVLRLAIIAEYRDTDTGAHVLRVSEYCCALARALKMSEHEIEVLRFASPMHDIGKIGIPDSILKKPGKLTAEEFDLMKEHTLIGWRMFENATSPILRASAEICRCHHEKWDGTGYPAGLKGDKIPLSARIVALVDIFDAITSKRCYKDAWSFEESLKHIKSLAGNHLDPHIVSTFIKIKDTILGIYNANQKIQAFLAEYEIMAEKNRNET